MWKRFQPGEGSSRSPLRDMKSSRTFQAKQLTSTAYLSRCPPPTGRSPGRAPPAPAWTPGWDPPAPAWPLSSFPSCLQLTAWSADIPPRPSQQRQLVTTLTLPWCWHQSVEWRLFCQCGASITWCAATLAPEAWPWPRVTCGNHY